MRTSRTICAAAVAAVAFLAVGCGTPSLPHLGVSSPYYGLLKAGGGSGTNSPGDVNNSDTFSTCSITGGAVTVRLGEVSPSGFGPFYVSINGTAAVELDATGDSTTSASILTPGDCFSVVVSAEPYVYHRTCIDVSPFCTPEDFWVSNGVPYIVTW